MYAHVQLGVFKDSDSEVASTCNSESRVHRIEWSLTIPGPGLILLWIPNDKFVLIKLWYPVMEGECR